MTVVVFILTVSVIGATDRLMATMAIISTQLREPGYFLDRSQSRWSAIIVISRSFWELLSASVGAANDRANGTNGTF